VTIDHRPESLTGAQLICRVLEEEGVSVLFGYPGGAIMPFYHALPEFPALRHILVRHEQAAAHAADGYARATGRAGVCVATSGPGATNLVTGLATAYMDNSPVVAITGQVPRAMMGKDAFQETDIVGIALPITKWAVVVEDISQLADVLRRAFRIAQVGRPGPVLVDIPKDVQNQRIEYDATTPRRLDALSDVPPASFRRPGVQASRRPGVNALAQAAELIESAERPLLLAGHGIILGRAHAELRRFAEHTGIPVITTLLGISAFPEDHRLHLGMPGMHGEVHVNRAIQHADLLIAVGMRFDDRVTGNTAGFARNARIIHIEIDPTEIGKNVPVDVPIIADAASALAALTALTAARNCDEWQEEIRESKRPPHESFKGGITPEGILGAINTASAGRCSIVSDVGQHQMWVAKLFPYRRLNSHFTSGGLGSMGFAVPAAIGVHLARPDEPVWAISGDGGFQMNMQEIATMVQEGLSVKLAIFNNGYLGMVRQWQQFFHGRRYSATPIWSPDYVKLAEAYGIAGWRVEAADQVAGAVEAALRTEGPALVEFVIEQEANVYPMIPPGASLSEFIEREPAPEPAST
jgi:acetolactate synthase-1/2/3 large subunit